VSRKRCRCAGHWRQRLTGWSVSQRKRAVVGGVEVPSRYSELYCRSCRSRWRTAAGYVQSLPDVVKRSVKPKPMSDRLILRLIRLGRIKVEFATGRVFRQQRLHNRWREDWRELTPRADRNRNPANGSPYYFVIVIHKHRRKEIVVSKLVWMAYHNQLVPAGHDIDHKNRDKTNNSISNLRLLRSEINRNNYYEGQVPF